MTPFLETPPDQTTSVRPLAPPSPEAGSACRAAHWMQRHVAAQSGCSVTLPLRRFRPPIPVRVKTHPASRHPLEILDAAPGTGKTSGTGAFAGGELKGKILDHRGPWLHSGDWWDHTTQWSRKEWDIHHENTHLYRLTHNHQTNQWLLEGTYG